MLLTLTWQQIALRLSLAIIASFFIGLNRDEHGKTAGMRTTMLVCLAATLTMIEANLLIGTAGKTPTSFIQLDVMRLPLGILSGIGFIGAGAILRKGELVRGLTTAATLWIVTVLGLLFGAGLLRLGAIASALTLIILWLLKHLEKHVPSVRSATLLGRTLPPRPAQPGISAPNPPRCRLPHHELEGPVCRLASALHRMRTALVPQRTSPALYPGGHRATRRHARDRPPRLASLRSRRKLRRFPSTSRTHPSL